MLILGVVSASTLLLSGVIPLACQWRNHEVRAVCGPIAAISGFALLVAIVVGSVIN